MKIWRELLRSKGTIHPGWVTFIQGRAWNWGKTCHDYQYEEYSQYIYGNRWDEEERESLLRSEFVPRYNNYTPNGPLELEVTITSYPSSSQTEGIDNGLELDFKSEIQVSCEVIDRDDTLLQVINQMKVDVKPFTGLAILGVSKLALAECSQILYGENSFAFSTAYSRADELTHLPQWIPGKPNKDGTPQSPRQLKYAIDLRFAPGSFRCKYVARDPMLQFFHRIGRINTSLLTKIKISGMMKTLFPGDEIALPGFDRDLDTCTRYLRGGISQFERTHSGHGRHKLDKP